VNDGRREASRLLAAKGLASLALVRAFATAQRDPAAAADAIDAVRATERSAFAYWGVNWPEFERFVRAHNIGA
jgi:hypothetical protein